MTIGQKTNGSVGNSSVIIGIVGNIRTLCGRFHIFLNVFLYLIFLIHTFRLRFFMVFIIKSTYFRTLILSHYRLFESGIYKLGMFHIFFRPGTGILLFIDRTGIVDFSDDGYSIPVLLKVLRQGDNIRILRANQCFKIPHTGTIRTHSCQQTGTCCCRHGLLTIS